MVTVICFPEPFLSSYLFYVPKKKSRFTTARMKGDVGGWRAGVRVVTFDFIKKKRSCLHNGPHSEFFFYWEAHSTFETLPLIFTICSDNNASISGRLIINSTNFLTCIYLIYINKFNVINLKFSSSTSIYIYLRNLNIKT